jgi:hypothetical protein
MIDQREQHNKLLCHLQSDAQLLGSEKIAFLQNHLVSSPLLQKASIVTCHIESVTHTSFGVICDDQIAGVPIS